MTGNYFVIDGSALLSQIRQLQKSQQLFRNRKLCPRRFIGHFMSALLQLHGGAYKRATFYFPKGDEAAIADFLDMPDHKIPGEIEDIHFKFCGYKLKRSSEFDRFIEDTVPSKWHDRFQKSEKGVDIEMCCDAFKLASSSKIERLFLLTNDGDFIPFCRAIKEFGANISILHLSSSGSPNGELLRECDSFHVVQPDHLDAMFTASKLDAEDIEIQTENNVSIAEIERSDKPDAEPSDLIIHSSTDN